MAVSFNEVPSSLLTPGFFGEFDKSQAVSGPGVMPYRALLIGQMLATGTAPPEEPTRIYSADEVGKLAGRGSMLHGMAKRHFAANSYTETWMIAVEDDPSGQPATGSVTFGGQPTEAGTLNLYIAGARIRVGITSGQSLGPIATAVAAAITANPDLPVTAVVDGEDSTIVTFTAKHAGLCGNAIDVRANYQTGEASPTGLTLTFEAMSGGTANPELDGVVDAMGDEQYHIIALPFTDATSIDAIDTELRDRWGPLRQIEGFAFSGARGDAAGLGELGGSLNSEFVSIMDAGACPMPPWEFAASVAAVAAYYGEIDRGRPFQTLELSGLLGPVKKDRRTQAQRNQLLQAGISTFVVNTDGTVRIDRLVTTYKENEFGVSDPSYQDVNTLLILGYLRWDFRSMWLRKYPRHKLANDGTRFGTGQAIITPKLAKAESIAKFREWEEIGLVENAEQFKRDLVCERNASDPNRLDFILPPDLINQLRVTAAQFQFRR
ncbi:phage tail sheath subtilisin-like domain-containing protein [Salinicola avicenniae]|uniref:phage tail sheath subtilisin-like domain-containing protein n=1 Tax=Salinicola avicenniae TaxID=2916836 RepID=UPI002072CECE|nr:MULTISPECIES: phage tail sheath subtilisin-like domain-containing protein [unclassified Salinicola]